MPKLRGALKEIVMEVVVFLKQVNLAIFAAICSSRSNKEQNTSCHFCSSTNNVYILAYLDFMPLLMLPFFLCSCYLTIYCHHQNLFQTDFF